MMFSAQEAIEHFKQANSELRSENGQLRAELASLRAERDALRARVAELETATDKAAEQIENGDIRIAHDVLRATNIGSATLTPRRCRTCAREAAREMRDNAASICSDWNRAPFTTGSTFGGDTIPFAMRFHLADAISSLPLPDACGDCNLHRPEADETDLRGLIRRAATVMNDTGNALNWPDEMPMEYAEMINELREASEREATHE